MNKQAHLDTLVKIADTLKGVLDTYDLVSLDASGFEVYCKVLETIIRLEASKNNS